MTQQEEQGLGSDTDFAFLCFGFVSFLLICAYVPTIWGFITNLGSWERTKASLTSTICSLTFIPRKILYCLRNTRQCRLGFQFLISRPKFTRVVVWPKIRRNMIRPRLILIVLFFFLLSIVAYQKFSFDAYETLGLPQNAPITDVKRAYKKLSFVWHPDKNKAPEARAVYAKIKRAYKILTSEDPLEEAQQEDGKVGEVHIALPKFLLNKKFEAITIPLLLSILIIPSVWLLLQLKGTSPLFIVDCFDSILWLHEEYDQIYKYMGLPLQFPVEEPKKLEDGNTSKPVEEKETVEQPFDKEKYKLGKYFINQLNEYVEGVMFKDWVDKTEQSAQGFDRNRSVQKLFHHFFERLREFWKSGHKKVQDDYLKPIMKEKKKGVRVNRNWVHRLQQTVEKLNKLVEEIRKERSEYAEKMRRAMNEEPEQEIDPRMDRNRKVERSAGKRR
jgi:hypothetical protein